MDPDKKTTDKVTYVLNHLFTFSHLGKQDRKLQIFALYREQEKLKTNGEKGKRKRKEKKDKPKSKVSNSVQKRYL